MPKSVYWVFLSALMLATPAASQAIGDAWPDARPDRIIRTPNWSDYNVYPPAARRKNQEGTVVAAVLVDATGTPTNCRIETSSGHAELDAGTCSLLMEMRFVPAHAANGEPVASQFRRIMHWILDDPRPFASSALEARLAVEDGKVSDCAVTRAQGPYSDLWSTIACSFFRDADHYLGDKARKVKTALIAVRLDAGDQDALLGQPWPDYPLVSRQRVEFTVNKEGDPSDCKIVIEQGFGPAGLNTLSMCGRLLSDLWLKKATNRHGTFETRVYAVEGDVTPLTP